MTQQELRPYSGKVLKESYLNPYPLAFYSKKELLKMIYETNDPFEVWLFDGADTFEEETPEEDLSEEATFEWYYNDYCRHFELLAVYGEEELNKIAQRLNNPAIIDWVLGFDEGFDTMLPLQDTFILAVNTEDNYIWIWTQDGGPDPTEEDERDGGWEILTTMQHDEPFTLEEFLAHLSNWEDENEINEE